MQINQLINEIQRNKISSSIYLVKYFIELKNNILSNIN